ncbi:MAG: hypothetical protein CM15mP104_4560 [Gammaproteobacteria bacterium]|nr:MAG: hypothetical protein CM15mP104_4560 [Gammaproteobacteria bacterium]
MFIKDEYCVAAINGLRVPVPKAMERSLVNISSLNLYFSKQSIVFEDLMIALI